MKIPCSSCNQRLEIPEELAGQTIECPACNASLAVPPPAPAQVQESAPQAASSKKSKPPIPKWVIAAVVIVVLMLVIFNGSKPKAQDISIHDAAGTGDIEAVKKHLAEGADVNAKDNSGWTPLHHAAIVGQKEIVELLIDNSADVNAKALDGETPLDSAITFKHPELADVLRKHGAKTGDWLNADNSIHSAAGVGHIEAVKQHLAKGADVNTKDGDGDTPLDWAIIRNHTETADLLRKHGGKTGDELKAADKPTVPVAEAAQLEPPTAKAPDISIDFAAESGNIEAVKQHLDAGTDVNVGRLSGITPLHYAAYHGHKEVAELLIAKGADVNAKDVTGRTPLDSAIFRNHPETANLLRKHGGKRGRR
jgi:cytohesin